LDWQLEARQDTPGFPNGACLSMCATFLALVASKEVPLQLHEVATVRRTTTVEGHVRLYQNPGKIQGNQEHLS